MRLQKRSARIVVTIVACLLSTLIATSVGHSADRPARNRKTGTAEKYDAANNPRIGKPQKVRFRVGAEITASRGACRNIVAMVAVPIECTEQQVVTIEED